jgi:hypothetical protein
MIFLRTNVQHQSLSRGLRSIDSKGLHPTYNWANEVDIKNRKTVDDVEDHGDSQEGPSPDSRHGERVCASGSENPWTGGRNDSLNDANPATQKTWAGLEIDFRLSFQMGMTSDPTCCDWAAVTAGQFPSSASTSSTST